MSKQEQPSDDVHKTRLSGDSEIYNKDRQDLSPSERWKIMDRTEKFLYYKEYYLKYTILLVLILCATIYVIYFLSRPTKKDAFFLGMFDGIQFNSEIKDDMPEIFSKYLSESTDYDGYNNAKQIFFNSFYNTIVDDTRIDGFYDNKRFDMFLAKPDTFTSLAKAGRYLDLSSVLPDELLTKLEPYLVYETIDGESKSHPYGIKIEDTNYQFFDANDNPIESCVIGIADNTQRKEICVEFIRFLYK